MKKTFITTMPDKAGVFYKASKSMQELGVNITRVSYNKAVDMHTLFVEVSGHKEKLRDAEKRLFELGFLREQKTSLEFVVLEFKKGDISEILKLTKEFGFNISYISSREDVLKLGFVSDRKKYTDFLDRAKKISSVKTLEHDNTKINYDNTIFYDSFAKSLANMAGLDRASREKLAVYTNMAMHHLDDRGEPAFVTFDCIKKFARHISLYKGKNFSPRITWHTLTDKTDLIVIEPPCGSNTMILKSGGEYLFIDTGYACYTQEMEALFRRLFHDYDSAKRQLILTHSDIDHVGLVHLFDKIHLSQKSHESLKNEWEGKEAIREQNSSHKPYYKICKLLTGYVPPNPDKMHVISRKTNNELFEKTGTFDFHDMHFTIYEGAGGHVPGEIVLADEDKKVCFTGDIFINLHDMISTQKIYNTYAPILLSGVDVDSSLSGKERECIKKMFADFRIFGSHGPVATFSTKNFGAFG